MGWCGVVEWWGAAEWCGGGVVVVWRSSGRGVCYYPTTAAPTTAAPTTAAPTTAAQAKLLASLRAARTNDEQALNESRTKQAAAEEKLKRARGEISRRKAQIEALMAAQGLPPGSAPPASQVGGRTGAGTGSVPLASQPAPTGQGGLAAADSEKENLREKLRASSMDRARAKQQAHVLRTKVGGGVGAWSSGGRAVVERSRGRVVA